MEATLADINRDGWELDDAEAIHNEFPTSFWLPPRDARNSLQAQQLVKLIFRIVATDERGAEEVCVERMCVIVKGRVGNLYIGQLDNAPYCTDRIQAGMEVCFLPNHVIYIYNSGNHREGS
ncbi:DUF2314 domain-containing protein [Pseudomonas sp. HMWF006]|uniref:DUF2314 domain-containing protein n=1 Tax=Pseudomonas sp. HMWF006 TaxID=2056843 RepID=UPI000D40B2E4|nr:DUF2314 domain-containing protein [Pseudomonas sp. HMWF006]PTS99753.1 DUF2314 domain-containing protein [Pseudomonas sp. HMWF006]PTT60538.1 DUF2314 domain-containing protein [Pseudomonas sp. HMWF007]PTT85123.1 DUF2314 domain-containing protein [Pseudomonas sp. HMWF005]